MLKMRASSANKTYHKNRISSESSSFVHEQESALPVEPKHSLQFLPQFFKQFTARVVASSPQACGYYKHSWSHFNEAIKIQPRCREAYEGRAIASLYACNIDAALIDIQSALSNGKKASARVLTLAGVIYQCTHNLKQAMSMYKVSQKRFF